MAPKKAKTPKLSPEEERVRSNCEWIEDNLYVGEGELVGQPLRLEDYQKQIIHDIYGNPHGTKRYCLSMPRKQGKSSLVAALLALHLLGPEAIPNSQLYCASLKKKQAGIIFDLCLKMIEPSATLAPHIKAYKREKTIVVPALGTRFEALAKDSSGASSQGLSSAFYIFDELGEVNAETDALFSALDKSTFAYKNSLSICISTAASRNEYIFNRLVDDALSGSDPTIVARVYSCPMDIDPFSEEAIKAASPAYGTAFFDIEKVRSLQAEARRNPVELPEFRNKNLNQRVAADASFLPYNLWEACIGEVEDWQGKPVILGLDLSASRDLTALTIISLNADNTTYSVHPMFWLPDEALHEKEIEDKFHYKTWADRGTLRTIPGDIVDYAYVAEKIMEIHHKASIQKIAFDRWNIKHFKKAMIEAGMTEQDYDKLFLSFGQGLQSMHPAIRNLENMIRTKKLRHSDDPILNWNFNNLAVKYDEKDNRIFRKQSRNLRIDGMIMLTMACGVLSDYAAMQPVRKSYLERRRLMSA